MFKHRLSVDEILKNTYRNGVSPKQSDSELLSVYDENGTFMGVAPRLLCHRLGLIHKVAYLMIGDGMGNVLLQTRGDGRLDMAVGGHVSSDDPSVLFALAREAKEEISLTINPLNVIKVYSYFKDYELNPKKPADFNREIRDLYYLEADLEMMKHLMEEFANRIEQDNVKSIRWFNIKDVITLCEEGKSADGLKSSIKYYADYLKA